MKDISTIDSYPLYWPEGFRRSRSRERSRFGEHSLTRSRDALRVQVGLLGGTGLVISTNMKTAADGDVRSTAKEPVDPGVAIFFKLKGEPKSLCCDKWGRVWENTWALAKTIEAMRGINRWGASELLQRMFKGFTALPLPEGRPWWEVLGVERDAAPGEIRDAYRKRIMKLHPDVQGDGDHEKTVELNRALEEATR